MRWPARSPIVPDMPNTQRDNAYANLVFDSAVEVIAENIRMIDGLIFENDRHITTINDLHAQNAALLTANEMLTATSTVILAANAELVAQNDRLRARLRYQWSARQS